MDKVLQNVAHFNVKDGKRIITSYEKLHSSDMNRKLCTLEDNSA